MIHKGDFEGTFEVYDGQVCVKFRPNPADGTMHRTVNVYAGRDAEGTLAFTGQLTFLPDEWRAFQRAMLNLGKIRGS